MMRIHHLNCGCMCPVGGALFDGFSRRPTAQLACHCLLIETEKHGLVLVDTGFGMQDMLHPEERLSAFFRALNRIQYDSNLTALKQIEALGFAASDVRHIVLTHLDFDHAGGIEDFPGALAHVLRSELEAVEHRHGFIGARRYSPQQFDAVKRWSLYEPDGETWFGFKAVRDLKGLPPELLFVPMPGHTPGHAAIAIQTGRGWLLHAGDAYFYRHQMAESPRSTPGLAFYQNLMETNHQQRCANLERLWLLANNQKTQTRVFCSHDMLEFKALAGRPKVVGSRSGTKADRPDLTLQGAE
jgi:glyoxylase-like metal-dependent hydrolase (beta-lactamase superfamily II)